jgi:hypothetical protein
MQLSHVLGTGVLIAAISVFARGDATSPTTTQPGSGGPQNTMPAPLPAPPIAAGHFVLVVEGDRNGIAITFASKKAARWAGVPKGFKSNWHVTVLDARGAELAIVPLDVRPFATDANAVGKPARVHGCIVVDSKIGLLVNVPAYATAASYVFARTEPDGTVTTLGTTTGAAVRELAGRAR